MWPDIWGFTKIRRSARGLFAANPKYPATAKDIASALLESTFKKYPNPYSNDGIKPLFIELIPFHFVRPNSAVMR